MSILPTLCTYVGLPQSQIKSPGHLLRETNKSETVQQQIRRLIKHFKTPSNGSSCQTMPNSRQSPKRSHSSFFAPLNFTELSWKLMERKSEDTLAVKGGKEDLFLIEKAIQILSLYGITLKLETPQEEDAQIAQILTHLIPELGFFLEGFIKRLNINKFVICNDEDISTFERRYSSQTTAIFPLSLQTREQVSKHLYSEILSKIIIAKPNMREEWNQIHIEEPETFLEESQTSFDSIFIALMQNINLASYKTRMEKMRELLITSFPIDFNEDWFKNRSKDKKKSCKVQFSCQDDTIIP